MKSNTRGSKRKELRRRRKVRRKQKQKDVVAIAQAACRLIENMFKQNDGIKVDVCFQLRKEGFFMKFLEKHDELVELKADDYIKQGIKQAYELRQNSKAVRRQ